MFRLLETIHPKLPFLFRYGVSGGTGAVIQLLADYVVVGVFHQWYMYGVVLGFFCALAATFTLQKYWTFKENSKQQSGKQFTLYTIVSLVSLFANALLMHAFVDYMHIWYLFAQAITVLIVAGSSFFFHNFITFKGSKEAIE